MFTVHRDMEFWMHKSGLHYYDPRRENNAQLAFVNTVAENKLGFTSKRQIKDAEVAMILYMPLWVSHP